MAASYKPSSNKSCDALKFWSAFVRKESWSADIDTPAQYRIVTDFRFIAESQRVMSMPFGQAWTQLKMV